MLKQESHSRKMHGDRHDLLWDGLPLRPLDLTAVQITCADTSRFTLSNFVEQKHDYSITVRSYRILGPFPGPSDLA